MNWSIDAEWYDANKDLPPVDEEVLCAVKFSGPVWNAKTKVSENKSLVLMYLGLRGPDGWFLEGDGGYGESEPRDDVSCWTWLPKLPTVLGVEHEEND